MHTYSPYDFHLWDPTILKYLLKQGILKSGRMVADGCKIIVGLGKTYNDKIKILNFKVNLSNLMLQIFSCNYITNVKFNTNFFQNTLFVN